MNVTATLFGLIFGQLSTNAAYFELFYFDPGMAAKYCGDRVCLSVCVSVFVCPRAYLWNYMSDFTKIFVLVAVAVTPRLRPWFGPPLAA